MSSIAFELLRLHRRVAGRRVAGRQRLLISC